jgi:hypothetical protein
VWSEDLAQAIRSGTQAEAAAAFLAEYETMMADPQTGISICEWYEGLSQDTSTEDEALTAEPAGCERVHLGASVPAPLARALRRTHVNLGHPSESEMLRILRASNAKEEAIAACKTLSCEWCESKKQPKAARPARVPRHPQILSVVQLDMKEVRGWKPGTKVKMMGIIDEASYYHQAAQVKSTDSQEYRKVYRGIWAKPLTPPDVLKVDAEKALITGPMKAGCEREGTFPLQAAGEAHHQVSLIERHNGMLSDLLDGVISDTQPQSEEEWDEALHQTLLVKNQFLHKAGVPPEMAIFGRCRWVASDLTPDPEENVVAATLPLTERAADFAAKCRMSARKRLAD